MENREDRICNEGIVKAIENDIVTVEITVRSACSSCHAKAICLPSESKINLIKAKNIHNEHFQTGERVSVYMKKSLGKKAVVLGYLIPFAILFTSLFVINSIIKNELISALSAIILVALYYFVIWFLNRKSKIDKQFLFMVKKLD